MSSSTRPSRSAAPPVILSTSGCSTSIFGIAARAADDREMSGAASAPAAAVKRKRRRLRFFMSAKAHEISDDVLDLLRAEHRLSAKRFRYLVERANAIVSRHRDVGLQARVIDHPQADLARAQSR